MFFVIKFTYFCTFYNFGSYITFLNHSLVKMLFFNVNHYTLCTSLSPGPIFPQTAMTTCCRVVYKSFISVSGKKCLAFFVKGLFFVWPTLLLVPHHHLHPPLFLSDNFCQSHAGVVGRPAAAAGVGGRPASSWEGACSPLPPHRRTTVIVCNRRG